MVKPMLAANRLLAPPWPDADNAAAVGAWRTQAEYIRLYLTRALASATHVDILPTAAATQVSAKLSVASCLLHDAGAELGLVKADLDRLNGLTLKALHHAWGTRHNGFAGDRIVSFEYHPDFAEADVAALSTRITRAPFEIRATKIVASAHAERRLSTAGTIAHESVHEAQCNTLPDIDVFSRPPLQIPPPDHARPGYLFMSRNIPKVALLGTPDSLSEHPIKFDHYSSLANEIQARLEGKQVGLWAAEHERDLHGSKPLPASVLAPIVARLVHAASALSEPVPVEVSDASTSASTSAAASPPPPSSALRFGAEHAPAYEQVMRVLEAVADVRVASASRGWSDAIGQAWGERLMDRLPPPPPLEPAAVLADLHALADRLDAERQQLGADGVRIGMRDRAPPTHDEFTAARRGSLRTAAEGIRHFASNAPATAGALAAALFAAIDPADFHARAQTVLEPGLTDEQREVRISDTVTAVAARLLGLPPAAVPRPGVVLYDAPNAVLPKVEGLNTDAGQARKISFVPESWQLVVPRHALRSPLGLAASLARRSFDMAYTADLLRLGRMRWDSALREVGAVRPVEAMLLAALPLADQARLQDPGGPADLLRAATLAHTSDTSPHAVGRWFHEGPRARLKAEATEGDAAALDHYRTNAVERWKQPAVALRRALASVALQTAGLAGAPLNPQAGGSRSAPSPAARGTPG